MLASWEASVELQGGDLDLLFGDKRIEVSSAEVVDVHHEGMLAGAIHQGA